MPTLTKRPKTPVVRAAQFEDYGQIANVLSGNGLPEYTADGWRHLWLGNPAYKALGGEWPTGWVLEAADGAIVGVIGAVPLAFELHGERLTAAVSIAWAVNPEYRAFSLMLLGRLGSQPRADLHLTTSASPNSAAALSGRNWSHAPGQWDACGFWITNYAGFVRSWLRKLSSARLEQIGSFIAPPLVAVDRIACAMNRPVHAYDVAFQQAFDDRFDSFWEELRAKNGGTLLAVRSRDVLEWRFRGALDQNRLWIATASAGGRLLGYAILGRRDNAEIGLKRVRILDCQILTGGSGLCSAILSHALDRCRREGIHVLEDYGCWFEGARYLNQPAPRRRRLKAWSYFYKPAGEGLRTVLADPVVWSPTGFDGD